MVAHIPVIMYRARLANWPHYTPKNYNQLQSTSKTIRNSFMPVTMLSIYDDYLAQAKHRWIFEPITPYWEFAQRCHLRYFHFQSRCKVYCIYEYYTCHELSVKHSPHGGTKLNVSQCISLSRYLSQWNTACQVTGIMSSQRYTVGSQ